MQRIYLTPARRWLGFILLLVLLILPALALLIASSPSASANSDAVITGHLIPALVQHSPLHTTSTDRQLNLSISLKLHNQAKLDNLLQGQSDPHSPYYHTYLSTQQFTDLFSPTQADVQQVVSYLQSKGLHVSSIAPNRLIINATGSVDLVQQAFSTTIADYSLNGRTVYAPSVEPSVPTSLDSLILYIGGLNDVAQYHHSVTSLQPNTGPGGGYTPTELRNAYNANSLISSSNGSGQYVAIFELDGYKPSDVNAYLSYYSLGSANYSNVLVDGATNTAGAGAIEVELDMEIISALAPGAAQKVYIGPNSDAGVTDTYNRIVTDNQAKVTSISWGLCEADSGTASLASLHNIFQQGAAQGQSFFAASGDSGAYDCNNNSLAVDSPADDPFVTGVGGTHLTLSGNGYGSESVWSNPNDTQRNPRGSGGGGGYSSYFSKPSYQTGTGVDSNSMRHVPDVSADADPASGYSVYCTVTASNCSSGWLTIGGTSAAAPLWAAIAVDTNAYLANLGKSPLGSVNATLYRLFNTSQTYAAYHDVTSGNNLYYSATSGYDVATGIGTPDAWNFARDAAGGTSGNNDFSISSSPTSLSLTQGSSGSSTINTAVTSGSAATVSLVASILPAGPTVSLSSGSVMAGNSATLSISVGASVAPGNYTVTITGTEGSATHSTTVSVAVTTSGGGGGLTNGGFESGNLSGWICETGNTAVTSPVHSGSYALQLTPSGTTTGQCTQSITVLPNHTYTLSAFLGVQGGTSNWSSTSSYSKLNVSFTTSASQTSVTIFTHGWYALGSVYADDFSLS